MTARKAKHKSEQLKDGKPIDTDHGPKVPALTAITGSSNIAAIGYNAEASALFVRFHSGATWRYDGVKPDVYEQVIGAESIGKAFIKLIRDASGITPGQVVSAKPQEGK